MEAVPTIDSPRQHDSPQQGVLPTVDSSRQGVLPTIHTTGSRKTATARAFLKPGSGLVTINAKPLAEYFHRQTLIDAVLLPFQVTGTTGRYDVKLTVKGGGTTGQAGAVRHAIARGLLRVNREEFHDPLKKAGLLTRDPRVKERKKYGLKRARKAPTYRKR